MTTQKPGAARVLVSPSIWSRRRFLKASALGMAGLAVAGCTPATTTAPAAQPTAAATSVPTSASAGKTIRFINYVDWIGKGEYDQFKQKTGITVQEIVINQDQERVAKLAADHQGADALLIGLADIARLDSLGLLAELNLANIPNYAGVDPNFKRGQVTDEARKGIASDYGRVSFVYRSDLVDEELKTWADLWRVAPKYSGKINFLDYSKDVIMITLLMLGHDGNSQNEQDAKDAGEALIQIKPHLQALVSTDMLKPLLDGTGVIGMTWDFDASSTIAANPNVALKWVEAQDGMYAYLDLWTAINTSKVIPEIEQFFNNHLDPQVYANFCNTLNIAPIVPAAAPYVSDAVKNNPITFPGADVAKLLTFEQDIGEARRFWDDAWARFKSA